MYGQYLSLEYPFVEHLGQAYILCHLEKCLCKYLLLGLHMQDVAML